MPRTSAHRLLQRPRELAALLLCAAAAVAACATTASAGGAEVDAYSFPAFDATTTDALVVATNTSVLVPTSLLLRPERLYPELNRSEGFLVLSNTIDVWRAGAGAGTGGGLPVYREASFNTSFTLRGGADPVAFTVLLDRFPTFNNAIGLRGDASTAPGSLPNASSSLAAVEVGTVRSYAPEDPNVGLNVTVTPAAAAAVAVWIEYDAAAHRLSVYVAGAGEARPPGAILDVPLSLVARRTTQTAFVGFFAAEVRDILDDVRAWDLTVDRFPRDGKKGTSWWVILLAVVGSVAAAAAIVSAVVWYFVSRRRRLNMEPKI